LRRLLIATNIFPGSPRVPPDLSGTARRLLTNTETLCGAAARPIEDWNPKAKAVGELKKW